MWMITFTHQNNCVVDTIIINLVLQMKSLSYKEMKSLAQGQPARKW